MINLLILPSRPVRYTVLALLSAGVLMPCLVGCAKKDETPPASAGYYTGPMKKNRGGGIPGKTATPASTPGGGI